MPLKISRRLEMYHIFISVPEQEPAGAGTFWLELEPELSRFEGPAPAPGSGLDEKEHILNAILFVPFKLIKGKL